MSAASGKQVTVAYADAGTGTATSGTDYTALSAGTLTFAVGTTTQTIDVTVTGDATDEADETVAVTLSGPVNATLAAAATGTGTVTDDDGAPTVSIDSPSVTEGTGATGGTLRFTVRLSAASGKQVRVAYADAGTGTATSGTDYTAITGGTLTFAVGTTTRTIDVTVTGDGTDEANETVAVTLSSPVNATLAAGAATGTGTVVDDDGAPTLTLDAPSVAEGAAGATATLRFTVTLSPASAQQVTVNYADAGTGTATSGTDYTALTAGTLTFAAGTTSQTIDVTVTGDEADEVDETVAIALSAPVNAALGLAAGTGTITDDDDAPTVSIDSPSVAEGTGATGGTLRFTVRLSAASGKQVSVAYARTGGTATSGTDYTALTAGTLTFAAGTTTQTIDVTVTGDTADEADEAVVVTLSAPVNATLATATGTGTITDDDDAPTVSIDSPSVAEGAPGTAATLRFTVSLSAASGRQVTVAYADAGTGTATAGEDYATLAAGALTFAVGTTTRTIDVSVTGDGMDEANETVAVTLSAPVNATLSAAATGTGTVTDDDAAPTVSIDSPRVTEGTGATGGTLRFTVRLSAASGRQVTVAYADAGTGTATAGTDYTALTAGTLTFTAGTTTRTIDVAVTGDGTDEANETVAVTLSSPVNATLSAAAATGTGTVTDDDDAPTLSIDAPHVVEGAAGETPTLRFTVRLSAASGKQVRVAYADAGTGTATSGTDYTAITGGTLTFAVGTTTRTIDVTVTGDGTDEANETVAVTLSSPVNATLAAGAATGTGTVVDDDGAPTLTLDAPSVAEGAAGATATLRFTVTLSPASAQQVTVNYADAGTGTATSGTDYTALTAGTLTFAAGTTSQTIDVTVTGDEADEVDETVAIALSAPVNAALGLAAGTGTITDDDDAPTVSIDSPSVAEGTGATGGTLRFTVRLSAASGRPVRVAYARTGGTATAGAAGAPGTDYTALTAGTLTFPAGTTTQTIDVTVTGDAADEPAETVVVTLSAPVNATLAIGAGTGTITDDDDAPTVSIDSPTVAEGAPGTAATLRFTVRLSAASGRQVTVAYADAGTGTATSGEDYAALAARTLIFAPGATTRTIDVSVTGDAADEAAETVVITLSAPVNATLATGTGTGTVTDDDTRTLSIDSPIVAEGAPGTAATLRFTVRLNAASGRQVTVAYADAGTGTATSGTDYTALPAGTLTFAAGTTTRTIDVAVTGDAVDEPNETVEVTLSSPVNAVLAAGAATGTGTIADDDGAPPPPPALSIDAPRVTEGAPGTAATLRFTVRLNAASGRQVTVDYADAGTGTATSGTDYTALPAGMLTFAPGTTTRTIDVSVIGDAADEPHETVVVTLSAPVNATLAAGAATGTGTITDDDEADLRVETGGPGTTTRTVNGHTVTVVVGAGAPVGVVVVLPSVLDRDLVLRFAPPAAGVRFESARFGLGESAERRTVVDVTAQPVPPGGLDLCLPVAASLRAEAGERGLRLLHYGEAGWAPVARSRDEAAHARVCASGVTELSPFAAGYDDLKPTFGEAVVAPQRYREGTEIDPLTLPAAAGGNGPLAYALTGPSGTLPEGLVYTPPADATSGSATSGGTLTGTPAVPARESAWTLTATDTDGDRATLTFTVEVVPDLMPSFGDAQVPPQRYVQDVEITPLALPAAAGGNGPLAYALTGPSGTLPEGLVYTPPADATRGAATSGGTLTGTPAVPAEAAAYTLTVTDVDGDSATLTFTLEVEQDLMPSFGDAAVAPQRYREGTEIDPLTLPAATGGNGPLAYALTGPSGTLPEGLVYTPPADTTSGAATSGGTLTGTPAVPAEAAAYTLTVTDVDGDRATLTFTVEVVPDLMPSFGNAQVPPQRYVQDVEITPLALPAAAGGNGPLAYALTGPSGTLPEGLVYTPPADATSGAATSGGTLTGTPAVPAEAAAYTLTVTDVDGDSAMLTFTLEVEQDLMPSFGDAAVAPQRYREGTEIDPLTLPAATGGNGPLAYALTGPSGTLPEGLVYTPPADATRGAAASGGTLTGTPAVPARESAWTLTATDTDGDRATLTFTVEVVPDLMPSFGDAQVPPQRYVQDVEITPLALPAAAGGDLPLTYALTGPASDPALPEGLAWSEAAVTRPTRPGTLAGTPTVPAPAAAWTLTATDADGDRATLGFTVEVLDRLRVRLKGINEALLPDLSRAMTASTLDAVSGRIEQALSPDGAAAPDAAAPADVLTAFAGLLQANEQAIEDGTWSWRQGLDGRRFALALSGAGGDGTGAATGGVGAFTGAGGGTAAGIGAGRAPDAGARVTVWGAGDYRSLAGGEGSAVDWDGHLFGAHLGMDARFGAGGLAGLALSVSEGRFDYTDTSPYTLGETVEGEYESRMTSAHPYVGWAWPAGTHAWASLGYGRGDVTILDGGAGRQSSASTLRSAAAGWSVRVLSSEGPGVFGPMTVDLKGEAWTTRLEVADNGERIAGLAVRTHRLRGAVEGARAFALAGGAAFTPSVELGMRLDGGDGETGAGVELGGGLDYAHPALGLSADVAGRVLLAHEGGDGGLERGRCGTAGTGFGPGAVAAPGALVWGHGKRPRAAVGGRRSRARRRGHRHRRHRHGHGHVERQLSGRAAGHRNGLRSAGVRRGADSLRRPLAVRGRDARLPAGRALPARPGVGAGPRRRAPGERNRPRRARPDAARTDALVGGAFRGPRVLRDAGRSPRGLRSPSRRGGCARSATSITCPRKSAKSRRISSQSRITMVEMGYRSPSGSSVRRLSISSSGRRFATCARPPRRCGCRCSSSPCPRAATRPPRRPPPGRRCASRGRWGRSPPSDPASGCRYPPCRGARSCSGCPARRSRAQARG